MPASDLHFERKNGYDTLTPEDSRKMEKTAADYMRFLGAAKTEREAHDEAVKLLEAAGFRSFEQAGKKPLRPGDRIYRSCAGKTLAAAIIGKKNPEEGLRLIGAHTDAPRIDIKQNPLYESGELALLDTHYYGGIKKYQWVTVPLALHGVFIKTDGTKVAVKIGENESDPVFYISDLLIHMSQDQMKKSLAEGISGENLDIIAGSAPSADTKRKNRIKYRVLELLAKQYDVKEEDFSSAELEAVPAAKPREVGFDRSLIAAYGHDDRVCAYSALYALLNTKGTPERTLCALLCDKEEIGSYGATGMQSNFFENTVAEIIEGSGRTCTPLALMRALRNTKALSADVNSAYDPLYASAYEKKNAAFINQGACITKATGARGKSGASDANAEFVAEVRGIFGRGGVIWQTGELGKVDQGGGGTISMLMAHYGMDVVDCGVPVLSMHAPVEVVAKLDLYMTCKGFLAFFNDKQETR